MKKPQHQFQRAKVVEAVPLPRPLPVDITLLPKVVHCHRMAYAARLPRYIGVSSLTLLRTAIASLLIAIAASQDAGAAARRQPALRQTSCFNAAGDACPCSPSCQLCGAPFGANAPQFQCVENPGLPSSLRM